MFDRCYATLRSAQTIKSDEGEAFDDHVFAGVLSAVLADQAASGLAPTEGFGLTRAEAAALFAARFPSGAALLCLERAPDPARFMEEDLLRDLLTSHGRLAAKIPARSRRSSPGAQWARIISGRISACSTAAN